MNRRPTSFLARAAVLAVLTGGLGSISADADVRNPLKVLDVPGTNPSVGSPSGLGADPWLVRHAARGT
jgi:hypothetical protein